MNKIAQRLATETGGLITVGESNLGSRVMLPALYPTGEHVSLFLNEQDGNVILHDGGFALQSISSMGLTLKKHAHKHITEYASQLGCKFVNGRVVRRCRTSNMVGAGLTVANVCLYVASQFQSVPEPKEDFEKLVREALSKKADSHKVETNYKAIGASGGSYPVTAVILRNNTDVPSVIIEAVATAKSVNGRFRHLYDIRANPVYNDTERWSIYDQNQSFSQSDYSLLQDVSNMIAFSDLSKRMSIYAQ